MISTPLTSCLSNSLNGFRCVINRLDPKLRSGDRDGRQQERVPRRSPFELGASKTGCEYYYLPRGSKKSSETETLETQMIDLFTPVHYLRELVTNRTPGWGSSCIKTKWVTRIHLLRQYLF